MTNVPWLTAVTFLPLAGAIVIGFAPVRWARQLALGTALATWVVSLLVAANLPAVRARANEASAD